MSPRKHILFLTWKDIRHPHAGGAEAIVYRYAKGLVDKGYRVTWFASQVAGYPQDETIEGIEIIRRYQTHTIWMRAWHWYKTFCKNNTIDCIIDEAGGWPLLSPLYEKKIPILFFVHHIGDKEFDILPFGLGKIIKAVYNSMITLYRKTPTITVSLSTQKELSERFRFKSSNISIITNTTDIRPIDSIDYAKKTHDIVFVGRLTRIKRPEHAIHAFHQALSYIPQDAQLHIIGNQQDRAYVESLHVIVDSLGIKERVIFHGYLTQERYIEILTCSRCILVPSEKEGYGLVVIEANAYGLPAIGYNVAGLRDSIEDGKNGILVEDGDFVSMATKIVHMFDEIRYKKLAESSLVHAKSLRGWDQNIEKFEEVITSQIELSHN